MVSPVAGRVMKVHPHAFVVLDESGAGVLVHLGIDTVRLDGAGFTVHVADGAYVAAGSAIVNDVEPGQIAVARGRQRNVDGWVERTRSGTATAAAAAEARARHPQTEQQPSAPEKDDQ